jgi:hypothetical protein
LEIREDDVQRITEVRGGISVLLFGERRVKPVAEGRGQRGGPVRWNLPWAGVTAGEQRISRGIAAGGEGNALKTEILGVDVARNKATRFGWE